MAVKVHYFGALFKKFIKIVHFLQKIYKSGLLKNALFKEALFEEHHSAFNFICPHFEKNNEAVDHNVAGKNNENGETDETDYVDENAIDTTVTMLLSK